MRKQHKGFGLISLIIGVAIIIFITTYLFTKDSGDPVNEEAPTTVVGQIKSIEKANEAKDLLESRDQEMLELELEMEDTGGI